MGRFLLRSYYTPFDNALGLFPQLLRKAVFPFKGIFNGCQGIIVEIPSEAFLPVLSCEHTFCAPHEVEDLGDTPRARFDELNTTARVVVGKKRSGLEGKSKIYHSGGNT